MIEKEKGIILQGGHLTERLKLKAIRPASPVHTAWDPHMHHSVRGWVLALLPIPAYLQCTLWQVAGDG